jgi:hypothetical protein
MNALLIRRAESTFGHLDGQKEIWTDMINAVMFKVHTRHVAWLTRRSNHEAYYHQYIHPYAPLPPLHHDELS